MTQVNGTNSIGPWRRVCGVFAAVAMLSVASAAVQAQGLSEYREFAMGSGVSAVSALGKLAPDSARTVHARPALLQDLEWRPSNWMISASPDPVDKIIFSFYNDQLFRIVVDYNRDRTTGMTEADLVDALVTSYGPASPKTARRTDRAADENELSAIARWEDGAHAVVLYRPSFNSLSYRLMLTDTRVTELARKAVIAAQRLDDREAPARERAREQKALEAERDAAAKARTEHKRDFRP